MDREPIHYRRETEFRLRVSFDCRPRPLEATEAGDEEAALRLMRTLNEMQLEISRLESQEAIIDGFGVLSRRV